MIDNSMHCTSAIRPRYYSELPPGAEAAIFSTFATAFSNEPSAYNFQEQNSTANSVYRFKKKEVLKTLVHSSTELNLSEKIGFLYINHVLVTGHDRSKSHCRK
jgi:hypothetical protein